MNNITDPSSTAYTPLSSLFSSQGFVVIRSALEAEAVDLFVQEIEHCITFNNDPSVSDSPIVLSDPTTFPHGNKRRVAEVAPRPSISEKLAYYLRKETGPLAEALNDLFGEKSWEIRMNGDEELDRKGSSKPSSSSPRYWYCPIALPEDLPAVDDASLPSTALECSGPRRAFFCHVADQEFRQSISQPQFSWQPINRRRFLSKGWHIDVSPGFMNDAQRSTQGDIRQGVVLLILLSDCSPGCGGTALIPKSHDWSLRLLLRKTYTHEELNTEIVQDLRTATEAGRVFLTCSDINCLKCRDLSENNGNVDVNGNEPIQAIQVTGKKGDIVLVHSLLLHSGTTNLSSKPRLLANGMARFKSFGDCCAILRRDLLRF
jgi:hypothetical protein